NSGGGVGRSERSMPYASYCSTRHQSAESSLQGASAEPRRDIAVALPPDLERDLSPNGLPPGSRVSYSTTPPRNGAVALSLVCAILWPICLFVPILTMQLRNTPTFPDWLGTLFGFGLFTAPVIGIIAGGVGLYRALRTSDLRASWWRAVVGLVF